jgi:hypothetical protein
VCLGDLQIDGEFKLGRSPHWQIGGFGTVEDFADVDAALAIGFGEASATARETVSRSEFSQEIDRRMRGRERGV